MALPRPFFRLWHTITDPDSDRDTDTLNRPLRHRTGDRHRVHRLCQQSTSREEFLATVIVPSPCDKGEVRFALVNKETKKTVGGQLRKRTRNPHLACDDLESRGIPEMYHNLCRRGAMIPYEFSLVLPSRIIYKIHTIELRVRRCRIRVPSPPFYLVVEGSTRTVSSDSGPEVTQSPSLPMPTSSVTSPCDSASLREQLLQAYSSRTESTRDLYEKATEREARSASSPTIPTRALDWRNVTPDAPLLRILTGFSIENFNHVCSATRATLSTMHKNSTISVEDVVLLISTYLRHYKPLNIIAKEFEIGHGSVQKITSEKIAIAADALESRYISEKQPSEYSGHFLATVVFIRMEKSQTLRNEELRLGVSSQDPSRNRQIGVKFACVFDWDGHIRLVSTPYLGGTPDTEVLTEVCSSMQDVHIFNAGNVPLGADAALTPCHNQDGCSIIPDVLTEAIDRCHRFVCQTRESWRCLVDRFRGHLHDLTAVIRLCFILQWHQTM